MAFPIPKIDDALTILNTLPQTLGILEVRFTASSLDLLKSVEDSSWERFCDIQERIPGIKALIISELTAAEKTFILEKLHPLDQAGILHCRLESGNRPAVVTVKFGE